MLKQRIVTALLMALPVLAVLLWAPTSITIGLFIVVVLLGAWEWSGFLGSVRTVRAGYVVLIGILICLSWFWLLPSVSLHHLLLVVLAWWLLALLWIVGQPQFVSGLLAGIAGVLVLVPAWLSLALLQLRLNHGPQWVLFLFLLVVSADIGGFFFGRKFGRTKLAPRVSPGKTWEGALGGLVLATLVATAGAYWFAVPIITFVSLCVVTVILSVVGDLTESLFKRHAGLKDSSTLLPGHGGVLDRIDSLTAAAPVFLYGLINLGLFPL